MSISLINIEKLFDKSLSLKNKLKICSLFKRTKFFLQFKEEFRKSLSQYRFPQIDKRNWNRYLNGNRKIPVSLLNIVLRGKIPIKEIEKLRYGTKTITNREIIKQLLNRKFY